MCLGDEAMLRGQSVTMQIHLGKQAQTLRLGLVPTFPLWGATLHAFPGAGYLSLASALRLGLKPGPCPSSVLPAAAWKGMPGRTCSLPPGSSRSSGTLLACCLGEGWEQQCAPSKGGVGL